MEDKTFEKVVRNVVMHQIRGGFKGNTPQKNENRAVVAILAAHTKAVGQARRGELEQLRYQFAILVGEIRVSDVLKTIDENLATLTEHKGSQ